VEPPYLLTELPSKTIFLDRDGVINKEKKDYVKNIDEFEIFEYVPQLIKLLKENNYLVIIVTNQSAINRGLLTNEKLEEIHNYLKKKLKLNNTSIDGIYYCPHTPEQNCECRKPKPGLFLKAMKDFDIDLENSFMIGDSEKDIEAANKIGCKGILLEKDQKLSEIIKKIITKNA